MLRAILGCLLDEWKCKTSQPSGAKLMQGSVLRTKGAVMLGRAGPSVALECCRSLHTKKPSFHAKFSWYVLPYPALVRKVRYKLSMNSCICILPNLHPWWQNTQVYAFKELNRKPENVSFWRKRYVLYLAYRHNGRLHYFILSNCVSTIVPSYLSVQLVYYFSYTISSSFLGVE